MYSWPISLWNKNALVDPECPTSLGIAEKGEKILGSLDRIKRWNLLTKNYSTRPALPVPSTRGELCRSVRARCASPTACPACPEQSRGELAEGMPSRSIGCLLHQQHKRNVLLVSPPGSAIRGLISGLEYYELDIGGNHNRMQPNNRSPALSWLGQVAVHGCRLVAGRGPQFV